MAPTMRRTNTAGAQLRESSHQHGGSNKKPIVLETGTAKNELSRNLTWLSLRFKKSSN